MIKFIKRKDIIETPFSLNNPVKSFLYQALIKRNFDPEWGWEGKEATSSEEKWIFVCPRNRAPEISQKFLEGGLE